MKTDGREFRTALVEQLRPHIFVIGATAALLFKFWLTADIRIVPVYAPHDMTNFIAHARTLTAGDWFGPYDDLTLIKRPFFPIYLALLRDFGIPLPVAHTLLYAAACLVSCAAIRPAIKSQASLLMVFGVLLFNPVTYSDLAWLTNRSQVNPSLALLVVACALALHVRRRQKPLSMLPWSFGLGISISAFWLTREEAVWIVPCLALVLSPLLVASQGARSSRPARLLFVGVPLVIWLFSIGAVMVANGAHYGWYTLGETQAAEFVSAYNSLARIEAPRVAYIPVPRAAREVAYSISPAAKELQPGFDGPALAGWRNAICSAPHKCTDISGGFFMWALRDAVSIAGHYTNGAEARSFYIRLANQIDQACDSHTIACWPKAHTLMPPLKVSDIPLISRNFWMATTMLVTFEGLSFDHFIVPAPDPRIRQEYSYVVGSIVDGSSDRVFSGWLMHRQMKRIVYEGSDGQQMPVTFVTSPDVFTAFASKGQREYAVSMHAGNARFSVPLACATTCYIIATSRRNEDIRIPLDITHPTIESGEVLFHLDSASDPPATVGADNALKLKLMFLIGKLYTTLFPLCLTASLAALVIRCVQKVSKRATPLPKYAVFFFVVAMSSCVLIGMLAVITSLSFNSILPEYMSPLYPLVLFACAFTVAIELHLLFHAAAFRSMPHGKTRRPPGAATSAYASNPQADEIRRDPA